MKKIIKSSKILNVSVQLRNFKDVTSDIDLKYDSYDKKDAYKLPSILLENIYYILNLIYNMNLKELMRFSFAILVISKNNIDKCENVKCYKNLYNSYEQK